MPKGLFDDETKIWMQYQKKDISWHEDYRKWREEWRKRGPVEFAYNILRFDPATGKDLKLSIGQEEFLMDVGMKEVRLSIITAGRGSGKTFVLAVYIMWRIFCFDWWHIASMGGSQEQSDKIAQLVTGWIRNIKFLQEHTVKNIAKETATVCEGRVTFHACSATSVRGPHTHDLIIDEQAAGEEKGGGKFIQAAIYDVSTSPDIHIMQSSTAHYIHGDFLITWNNAEKLGYKRYQWSIARHTNGEKDPYKIYEDANPKHWLSNVPWILDRNIQILRSTQSNDKWLVEALGGISISSGLVFNPKDLSACICQAACDICRPYKCDAESQCLELLQRILWMEGIVSSPEDLPTDTMVAINQYVHNRVLGIDWGRGSPTAYVVLGQFREWVFVLDAYETVGLTDEEKMDFALELAQKWQVEVIRPDPREWALNNWIAQRSEAAVHELFKGPEGGNEKYKYLASLKKFVERHKLVIPKSQECDDLVRSMRCLTYDETGKIRKKDDHSSDAMMYAISYYDEIVDSSPLWELKSGERGFRSFWG